MASEAGQNQARVEIGVERCRRPTTTSFACALST